MKTYNTVRLQRDEGGWWVAEVAGAPDCHTQGRTLAEALIRICEAAEVCEIVLEKDFTYILVSDSSSPTEE